MARREEQGENKIDREKQKKWSLAKGARRKEIKQWRTRVGRRDRERCETRDRSRC